MARFLDVLFQHVRWLTLGLIAAPCLLGALALSTGHTRLITASVRVDPSSFVADAFPEVFSGGSPGAPPAQAAGELIRELVHTDWFVEKVLGAANRTEQTAARAADFRRRLAISVQGAYLVVLKYSTDRPAADTALVDSLLERLGAAVQAIEAQRAAGMLQVATAALAQAHDEMERSVDAARRYADSVGVGGSDLRRDPIYRTLRTTADQTTGRYQSLSAVTHQAMVLSATLPQLRRQTAFIIDGPTVEVEARMSGVAAQSLAGLAGAVVIELLVIYLVALGDPRIRSADDLRGLIEASQYLSIPRLAQPVGRGPMPTGW